MIYFDVTRQPSIGRITFALLLSLFEFIKVFIYKFVIALIFKVVIVIIIFIIEVITHQGTSCRSVISRPANRMVEKLSNSQYIIT